MEYEYPDTIQIGGHEYKIEFQPIASTSHDSSWVGDHFGRQCKITVATNTAKGEPNALSYIEQTFIHELLHAINTVYNNDRCDEASIELLAQGLLQVLNQLDLHLVKIKE